MAVVMRSGAMTAWLRGHQDAEDEGFNPFGQAVIDSSWGRTVRLCALHVVRKIIMFVVGC
jgi:hypothetical protein